MFLNTFKKSWTKFKCSKAKNSKSSCGQYGVLEVSFICCKLPRGAGNELKMQIPTSKRLLHVRRDKDIFTGASTFNCTFLFLLRASVELRKGGDWNRVSFVSVLGSRRDAVHSHLWMCHLSQPAPLDRASPSLTQREASRAGSGSRSTMHQEMQDLEELTYRLFCLPFPTPKSLIVFYRSHMLLWKI